VKKEIKKTYVVDCWRLSSNLIFKKILFKIFSLFLATKTTSLLDQKKRTTPLRFTNPCGSYNDHQYACGKWSVANLLR